jgi:hypothetical protein
VAPILKIFLEPLAAGHRFVFECALVGSSANHDYFCFLDGANSMTLSRSSISESLVSVFSMVHDLEMISTTLSTATRIAYDLFSDCTR